MSVRRHIAPIASSDSPDPGERALAEIHANIKREQALCGSPWSRISYPAEMLIKLLSFRTCLEHMMRFGLPPFGSAISDESWHGARPPVAVASWYHPFCHQSSQGEAKSTLHTHVAYPNQKGAPLLDPDTLLQCERCRRVWDMDLQPVPDSAASSQALPRIISYTQCPGNSTGCCEKDAILEWRRRGEQLDRNRHECLDSLKAPFLSQTPVVLSAQYLGQRPDKGGYEIYMGYLAWRKLWHLWVFSQSTAHPAAVYTTVDAQLLGMLRGTPLWGDFLNDAQLLLGGHLDRKAMVYTYDQEPEAVRWLAANRQDWVNELRWLNDYVGCRRSMTTLHFHLAKRAAQRAGTAVGRLRIADEDYQRDMTPGTKSRRDKLEVEARQRFHEIRSALLADPLEVPRRVHLENCGQWGDKKWSPPKEATSGYKAGNISFRSLNPPFCGLPVYKPSRSGAADEGMSTGQRPMSGQSRNGGSRGLEEEEDLYG